MDRRKVLAVLASLAAGGLSGCSDELAGDGGADRTSPTSRAEAQREQQVGEKYAQLGDELTTEAGIKLQVSETQLANEIAFSDGSTISAGDGDVFLLVRLQTTNTTDEPHRLPGYQSLAVLIGNSQYEAFRKDTFLNADAVSNPVTGSLYTGVDTAHPQVSSAGWVLFVIPREQRAITIAWGGDFVVNSGQAYWKTTVHPDQLPNLKITAHETPDTINLGETATIKLVVSNGGKQAGNFTAKYRFTLPAGDGPSDRISRSVPGEDQITWTETVTPTALGTVSFSVIDTNVSEQITVQPPTLAYGTKLALSGRPTVRIEQPTIAPQYSYETYDGSETVQASPGKRFAFVRFVAHNPTSETVAIPRADDIILQGAGRQFERASTASLSETTFQTPVEGTEYFATITAHADPGETVSGWLLYEVPDELSAEHTRIDVTWTSGWDTELAASWT